MFTSGNNCLCRACKGAPNELVVFRISLNKGLAWFHLNNFKIWKNLTGQDELDLKFRKLEFWVGRDPELFFNNLFGTNRPYLLVFP